MTRLLRDPAIGNRQFAHQFLRIRGANLAYTHFFATPFYLKSGRKAWITSHNSLKQNDVVIPSTVLGMT
jgi:hypothetical protein